MRGSRTGLVVLGLMTASVNPASTQPAMPQPAQPAIAQPATPQVPLRAGEQPAVQPLPGPGTTGAAARSVTGAADNAAAGVTDPDWPCVQRKVASLSPAAIWTGPAADAPGTADWRSDEEIARMVARLAQRRLPLRDATAEVPVFAASLPDDERTVRLTLLFAGLFETMDAERTDIIAGIERYARRQKEMAVTIRTEASALGEARISAGSDPAKMAELAGQEEQILWQTRVFNDRRASLGAICEVPRLVEQRLFALGRAISGALGK